MVCVCSCGTRNRSLSAIISLLCCKRPRDEHDPVHISWLNGRSGSLLLSHSLSLSLSQIQPACVTSRMQQSSGEDAIRRSGLPHGFIEKPERANVNLIQRGPSKKKYLHCAYLGTGAKCLQHELHQVHKPPMISAQVCPLDNGGLAEVCSSCQTSLCLQLPASFVQKLGPSMVTVPL